MAGTAQIISRFYQEALDEDLNYGPYLSLEPGGVHTYYTRPSYEPIQTLAELIDGAGLQRTVGADVFRFLSRTPILLRLLPYIDQVQLGVGAETPPDVITQKSQIRLLCRDAGVVHTIPVTADKKVRKMISVAQELPPEINVPQLLAADRAYPYYTEEYIEGTLVGDPNSNNISHYTKAFEQLSILYEKTSTQPRPVTDLVATLLERLASEPLNEETVSQVRDSFDQYQLPKEIRKSAIHGDVNGRNLIRSDDRVFLIDWEGFRTDYPIYDLFRPLLIQYYDTRDVTPFSSALDDFGRSPLSQVFASTAGPTVYDDDRWYPGVMLLAIVHAILYLETGSSLWSCAEEILNKVLRSV